jgi:hypothetical protein
MLEAVKLEQAVPFDANCKHIEQEVRELLKSLKSTKAARFNAADRLGAKHRQTTFVITMTNAFIIGLGIAPLIIAYDVDVTKLFNFITVIFSVIMLGLSLIQDGRNEPVLAEQLHRCALEVNALRDKVSVLRPSMTLAMLEQFRGDYATILQKYSVNHEDIDFERYKIEHADDFDKGVLWWLERNLWLRPKHFLIKRGIIGFLILETAVTVWLLIRFANPIS